MIVCLALFRIVICNEFGSIVVDMVFDNKLDNNDMEISVKSLKATG